MVGLRGSGQDGAIGPDAEKTPRRRGCMRLAVEAPEEPFAAVHPGAPNCAKPCCRLSRQAKPRVEPGADAGYVRLRGSRSALKVKYQDIEIGLDLEPEPGLADNGDLETDLQDLLQTGRRSGESR